jgi:death on curing protein
VRKPVWVRKEVVIASHEEMLVQHGGSAGIRDEGLLDSALNRPQQLFAYGKPTLFDLAAAYSFGIAKNHPFIDGNKRSAFLTAYIFLALNGLELSASETDATLQMLALASGELSEKNYAAWLKEHSVPIKRR